MAVSDSDRINISIVIVIVVKAAERKKEKYVSRGRCRLGINGHSTLREREKTAKYYNKYQSKHESTI